MADGRNTPVKGARATGIGWRKDHIGARAEGLFGYRRLKAYRSLLAGSAGGLGYGTARFRLGSYTCRVWKV